MTVTSRKYFTDWFVANGVTKDWGYDFTILSQADVVIQVRDGTDNTSIVEYTSDFGFFPQASFTAGTVRYPVIADALPVGKQIRIVRLQAYLQLEDIGKEGRFYPQVIEKAFDRVTILTQQVDDNLDRAVKVQLGGTAPELVAGIPDGAVLMKQGAFLVEGPNAESINSAQGYAEDAENARDLAQEYAQKPENVAVSLGGFSALHWAAKAATSAADALAAAIGTVRHNIAQALTPAQKGQARANIGGDILAGFRNKIINGNFDVWQRATSQTSSGFGSDDRWRNSHDGATKNHSRQSFAAGQSDVPGGPEFFSRTVVNSVVGSGNNVIKFQTIENVRTLAGRRATITFYAKADAPKSLSIELIQDFGTGGSPSAQVTAIGVTKFSLTTSWQKFSAAVDIPSIAGKTLGSNSNGWLGLLFWFDAGSSFNSRTNSLGHQSGTFDIARVSLVEGDAVAEDDPFSPRHPQQELALCQRYMQWAYLNIGWDASAAPESINMQQMLPVPMRAQPTVGPNVADPARTQVTTNANIGSIQVTNNAAVRIYARSAAAGPVGIYGYRVTLDAEL